MAQQTPTKRERREQARIERETLLRKAARRKQLSRIGIVALVVVVVAATAALVLTHRPRRPPIRARSRACRPDRSRGRPSTRTSRSGSRPWASR